jgi:hypothetical protein
MLTYSYDSPNIIQIALKILTGGDRGVKKSLSNLVLPLHVVKELLNLMYLRQFS